MGRTYSCRSTLKVITTKTNTTKMRLFVILTCFIGLSLQGRVLFPDADQSSRLYRKLDHFYQKLLRNTVSADETINNEINDNSYVKFKETNNIINDDDKSIEIVYPVTPKSDETSTSKTSSIEETDDTIIITNKAIKDSKLAQWQGEENSDSEEIDDYPETEILKMLELQGEQFLHLFNNDTQKDDASMVKIEPRARTGLNQDWKNLCDTSVHYTRPRFAKNKDGVSLFVVNFNGTDPRMSKYQQQVRVTKCIGDEAGMCGAMANVEVSTKCQQEFTDHKLVALDPSGKELIVDTFVFPSCCSCVYSNILWE